MVVKNTAVKHKMYTTAIKWTRDAFKGDSVFRKKDQKKTKIYIYVRFEVLSKTYLSELSHRLNAACEGGVNPFDVPFRIGRNKKFTCSFFRLSVSVHVAHRRGSLNHWPLCRRHLVEIAGRHRQINWRQRAHMCFVRIRCLGSTTAIIRCLWARRCYDDFNDPLTLCASICARSPYATPLYFVVHFSFYNYDIAPYNVINQ